MHVKRVMGPTPLSPVNFVLRVMSVIHGMHDIRVMSPTLFPLIKFVLSVIGVTRVMFVIRVMNHPPLTRSPFPSPHKIFGLRVMRVEHDMQLTHVMSPTRYKP